MVPDAGARTIHDEPMPTRCLDFPAYGSSIRLMVNPEARQALTETGIMASDSVNP